MKEENFGSFTATPSDEQLKVYFQLTDTDYELINEMLEKLSPLMHEHINFVGKYSFKYDPTLNDGRMRPLNIPALEEK